MKKPPRSAFVKRLPAGGASSGGSASPKSKSAAAAAAYRKVQRIKTELKSGSTENCTPLEVATLKISANLSRNRSCPASTKPPAHLLSPGRSPAPKKPNFKPKPPPKSVQRAQSLVAAVAPAHLAADVDHVDCG